MFSTSFIRRFVQAQIPRLSQLRCQSNVQKLNIEKLEQESISNDPEGMDEEAELREAAINKSRNKSNLSPQHQNIVHDKPAFTEPKHWSHATLRYQRKNYGKHGQESNFNPSLCWNREEIAEKKEYESVAYPNEIRELMEIAKAKRKSLEERIAKRQADIMQNLQKNEEWKAELFKKFAKKEAEAPAAKERKDKLIEEVRRHFGYTVQVYDERFKELLEQKEKEQRKAAKEARKKAKEESMIAKLTAMGKAAETAAQGNKDETQDETDENLDTTPNPK